MLFAVIDRVTVTVHLVDGISRRIVTARHTCILGNILLFKILVKLLVVDNTILRIIQVCQYDFSRCLADVEDNVGTLLRCRGIDAHTIFVLAACAVERVLIVKRDHVSLMCCKLRLAFVRVVLLRFRIMIFHNVFQRGIGKRVEQRTLRFGYQLLM